MDEAPIIPVLLLLIEGFFRLDDRLVDDICDVFEAGFYQVFYHTFARPSDRSARRPAADNLINRIIRKDLSCLAIPIHGYSSGWITFANLPSTRIGASGG